MEKKVDSLAVASGIALTVGGLVLIIVGFFFPIIIVYGIILFILGIVILATLKKQEAIEPIKERKIIKSRRTKR